MCMLCVCCAVSHIYFFGGSHTYSKISSKNCRSRKIGNIFQRSGFVSEYVKILPRFTLELIDSTLMYLVRWMAPAVLTTRYHFEMCNSEQVSSINQPSCCYMLPPRQVADRHPWSQTNISLRTFAKYRVISVGARTLQNKGDMSVKSSEDLAKICLRRLKICRRSRKEICLCAKKYV